MKTFPVTADQPKSKYDHLDIRKEKLFHVSDTIWEGARQVQARRT